jgi:hypothetical protein
MRKLLILIMLLPLVACAQSDYTKPTRPYSLGSYGKIVLGHDVIETSGNTLKVNGVVATGTPVTTDATSTTNPFPAALTRSQILASQAAAVRRANEVRDSLKNAVIIEQQARIQALQAKLDAANVINSLTNDATKIPTSAAVLSNLNSEANLRTNADAALLPKTAFVKLNDVQVPLNSTTSVIIPGATSTDTTANNNLPFTSAQLKQIIDALGIEPLEIKAALNTSRSISAPTTITSTDNIIVVTSGTFTQTLPTSGIFTITNIGTGTITITGPLVGTPAIKLVGSGTPVSVRFRYESSLNQFSYQY